MPVTRAELLAALKDPAVAAYLRGQMVQNASVTGLGRYPGQGSAQVDTYPFPDAADASFPYTFKYLLPGNYQRLVSAKLSASLAPYRSYSTINFSATGSALGNHNHSHNHGGGSHGHSIPFDAGPFSNAVGWDGGNMKVGGGGTSAAINSSGVTTDVDATNANLAHTHTVSGSTVLGISEDTAPVNPGLTVSVDGVDVTAKIGGPFNADMIEIDVTQVLTTTSKIWHTLSLQPNQRVRIYGLLSLRYYVDSRLSQ